MYKVYALLLADVCALFWLFRTHQPVGPPLAGDKELREAYHDYNQKYFKGKLPEAGVRVEWDATTDAKGNIASTWFTNYAGEGQCYQIGVNPQLKDFRRVWKFSLLHEMAHIKTRDPEHGRRFQREMLRLAKAHAFDDLW